MTVDAPASGRTGSAVRTVKLQLGVVPRQVDRAPHPVVRTRVRSGSPHFCTIRVHRRRKQRKCGPGARWFGDWSGDIRAAAGSSTYAADVADVADKRPVLVAYTIPGRDRISASADGIGGKPALVIIEGG
ncbi:hypothetical protein [Amycolatopsis sp. NPDC003861]